MSDKEKPSPEQIKKSLIDIAVESWRFSRLFVKLLGKLDAGESSRFINQHRFYLKRLDESLKQAGVRLVNVEGQVYDPGMAATALNAEDFSPDDNLIVDHMVEPIIMGDEGLIKTGTVMLKKRMM
ncbi:MAG: hypothetical protein KAI17_19130 [Thiotrichaceae bacterium]|nr:hypothetical protein [Thiotrichaceae bacterium]